MVEASDATTTTAATTPTTTTTTMAMTMLKTSQSPVRTIRGRGTSPEERKCALRSGEWGHEDEKKVR